MDSVPLGIESCITSASTCRLSFRRGIYTRKTDPFPGSLYTHGPSVGFCDPVDDGQPHSGAFADALRGEVGFENPLDDVFSYPLTGIAHAQAQVFPVFEFLWQGRVMRP